MSNSLSKFFNNIRVAGRILLGPAATGITVTVGGSETTLSPAELLQLKAAVAASVGDTYYAHSDGTSGQPGTKDQPKATADQAYDLCSAGDTVILLPGHAESITADSGLDMDTAGVNVAGVGYGARRPTFNHNGTTATKDMKMAAASNRLSNILVVVSDVGNDQAMALEMTATDCEVAYCEFRDDGTSQALNYITIGVTADEECDRCYIHHNKFRVTGSGSANSAISVDFDYTSLRLEYNDIYGDWDEAGIIFQTAANAQVDLRVVGNDVTNNQSAKYAIDLTASGSTGWVSGNKVRTNAPATALRAGGCAQADNWWSDGTAVSVALNQGSLTAVKTDVTVAAAEEEVFIVTGGPILVTGFTMLCTEEGAESSSTLLDDVTIEGGTSLLNDTTAELEIDDVAYEQFDIITVVESGPTIIEKTADITGHGSNRVLEAGALDIDGVNDGNVLATVTMTYTSLGGVVTVA